MYDAKSAGMRIKTLRNQFGNSREEIAGKIGRSAKFYADIERGICGISLDTLRDLADLYSVYFDFQVYGKTIKSLRINGKTGWWISLK